MATWVALPLSSLGNETVHPNATPSVERVSFSKRTDGRGHVVRLHLSDHVAGHSVPRIESSGVVSITLFRTLLSKERVLDNPVLPIESYDINVVDQDVVIQLNLNRNDLEITAYRDRDSDDILISLSTAGLPEPINNSTDPSSAERWTLDTIVIDAGHGGKDNGARAPNGLKEKDVVLAVALQLGHYITQNLGLNVVYTRNGDEFISLQGRGHIANQAGGKLFISIHANSANDKRATGTETFFLGLHKSDAAKQVMDRENEVIRFEEDTSQYERIDSKLAIMQTLAQSAYMRQSQYLADLVEDQFKDRAGRKSRGVKQAGFYVLYGASMPAILVELGFISNSREAAFLGSEDGQSYLASSIFRAIRDYKIEYEKGLHLSATSGK